MEKHEYEVMYHIEDDYWWYVGLRDLVFSFIDTFRSDNSGNNLRILDAGCGTGAVLQRLKDYGESYGIDSSEEAIVFCKKRGLHHVIEASVTNLPFADRSFDVIISLDVLYHLWVESDLEALKALHRVLRNGGLLILNLPAYDFLRSEHDAAIYTGHRYLEDELKRKVERAGFCVAKITYRNTMLFPLVLIIRLLKRGDTGGDTRSDLKPLPRILNQFLTKILFFENRLLRTLDFPFGLSVFCLAKKLDRVS